MRMSFSLVILSSLAVSGCVSAAQRQQQLAQMDAYEDAQCRSFTNQPGTPGYARCRMELFQMRVAQQQMAANRQLAASALMFNTGVAILNQPR